MLRSGKHSARQLTRARILLQVHQGKPECEVARNLGVDWSTVERTREKFVNSTCNGGVTLFAMFEPLAGERRMEMTTQRPKLDFAHPMKKWGDDDDPDADCLRLVGDNLNTPHPATLYESFEAQAANRILKKLEFHDPPKHASWLHQVDIEFSVLSRQCLHCRRATAEELSREVEAGQDERQAQKATVNWRFSRADARIRLGHLYPNIEHQN
jgi:DDE superfamily endonuclease/Homeodomain-like domain